MLKNGLIVTNNHVVEGCTVERLQGVTSGGEAVVFRKMATDPDVDLAALRPTEALKGGLELADAKDPDLGMAVSTWGYPLIYNGPAPLLSVGYVAGFSEDVSNGKRVKHLVINGAFNPGNSGGPLFKANDNKVIGVVVAKFHLYPPIVRNAIEALARNKTGVVYTATDPQGNQKSFAESEIVAMVLDQYYTFTQVMIGEAISVSEVRAFLKAHEMELR
ncbi:MAG TPA: serine protease [Terriglobales bacterium]|nr:serine protease [Terriglobales bacterium]